MLIVAFPLVILPSLFLTMGLLRRYGALGALWSGLVGLGLALCFIVFAASKGWLANREAMCGSDGCWIDSMRSAVEAFVGVSLGLWLVGLIVGAALDLGLAARRRRRSVDA